MAERTKEMLLIVAFAVSYFALMGAGAIYCMGMGAA